MQSALELVSKLAQLSVNGAPGGNKLRRETESQLSTLCSSQPLTEWLPLFFGPLIFSAEENHAKLCGAAGDSIDSVLSFGYCAAANGPSAESFVAASFLADFMQKNGKVLLSQSKESNVGVYCGKRLCALALEVAAVASTAGECRFSNGQVNWLRKLATVTTYCVQNNNVELTSCVRSLIELVHFSMDLTASCDLQAFVSSLPFAITNRTAHALRATQDLNALRGGMLAATLVSLHVLLKVASEKKMAQKGLKVVQQTHVGPSLINGEWIQELFFRNPDCIVSGTFAFNSLALARVFLLKLAARTLKTVLSAASFSHPSGAPVFIESRRAVMVGSAPLTAESVSAFMVSGLGQMLSQFAHKDLPAMLAVLNGETSPEIVSDPLAFRANYFVLKSFNRMLTDSFDGAVGAWTTIISPEVCASSIVSSIFSILMILPSISRYEGVAVSFHESSSCQNFDLIGHFEKVFFLCANSIQHICSMDESAPYYARVLQAVFPPGAGALSLAMSVIRRLLTEYLRDDNQVRGENGDFQQRLLSQWQQEPEKHFEELELLNDGDTSEGAAEQLFTSLTGCSSCKLPCSDGNLCIEKSLFPEAAWCVVNEMLTFNSESESQRELAKLMAYRAIGLGHYTLSEGQEDNYKSFFYNSLLPEMQSGVADSPLVQRRAIWCIGMWCESATATMRQDFFKGIASLLTTSGATLNPVILLTALKALEHFTNDINFDASHLPEGFVTMLFNGLRALFPVIRSPNVLQNVCGLVYVMVSKCGAISGIGDVMIEMLTPAVARFVEDILKAPASDAASEGLIGEGADDWGDEDDATGEIVGAVRIVLETLTTAMYSSASDDGKWASPITQHLLQLLKLLTDPYETQGMSGYFQSMLEDDAWGLWGAMVRNTSASYLGSSPAVVPLLLQGASYAMSSQMMERDFEAKAIYIRYIFALWLLFENFVALGGSAIGVDEFLVASRSALQSFALSTIADAMSTSDDDLLLVAIESAIALTALPSTSTSSAPVFMKASSDYFFGNSDSDLEATACSPSMLSLLSYALPRCVVAGTPTPSGLADKVNAIADVTTNSWSLARIAMLSRHCTEGGHLDFSAHPQDVHTLNAVAETCLAQLQASAEEESGQTSGNPLAYTGELIAEALSDDSRSSHHTNRLQQLLSTL